MLHYIAQCTLQHQPPVHQARMLWARQAELLVLAAGPTWWCHGHSRPLPGATLLWLWQLQRHSCCQHEGSLHSHTCF